MMNARIFTEIVVTQLVSELNEMNELILFSLNFQEESVIPACLKKK